MSTDSRVHFFSYSFSPPAFSCLSGLWAAAAPFSDLHVGTFLAPAVCCPGLCTHVNIYVSSCSLCSCCNPSGSFSGDTVLPVAAWVSFPYLPTWSPVRVSPAPVTCFYALLSHPPHGQCSTSLWVSLWTLSDSISLALSCSTPACCQAACFPLSSLRADRNTPPGGFSALYLSSSMDAGLNTEQWPKIGVLDFQILSDYSKVCHCTSK